MFSREGLRAVIGDHGLAWGHGLTVPRADMFVFHCSWVTPRCNCTILRAASSTATWRVAFEAWLWKGMNGMPGLGSPSGEITWAPWLQELKGTTRLDGPCSSMGGVLRLDHIDRAIGAFARAMRWGDFRWRCCWSAYLGDGHIQVHG